MAKEWVATVAIDDKDNIIPEQFEVSSLDDMFEYLDESYPTATRFVIIITKGVSNVP